MRKILCLVVYMGIGISVNAFAATPKDINYTSKAKSFGGGTYYIYNVRCSDGSKKVISAWDKRKKWCVGKSKKHCSNDQLKTAKRACQ